MIVNDCLKNLTNGGFEVAAAAAAHTSETKLAKAETDFAGSDFGNADDGGDALLA